MRRALLALAFLFSLLSTQLAWTQTSPARGPLNETQNAQGAARADAMPLADYLALLQQIAPAAEDGARDYLAAFAQRCGRALTTAELRRAMSQGDGDPVLMGLIRARQLQDAATREQLVAQIRCPGRRTR